NVRHEAEMIVCPPLTIALAHPPADLAMLDRVRIGGDVRRAADEARETASNERVISKEIVDAKRVTGEWVPRGDDVHPLGPHALKRVEHFRIRAQLQDGGSAGL